MLGSFKVVVCVDLGLDWRQKDIPYDSRYSWLDRELCPVGRNED